MLTLHRAGERRVAIPRDVEDQGEAAIEAYVEAAHRAAGPEALTAYRHQAARRTAFRAAYDQARADGVEIPDAVAAGLVAADAVPVPVLDLADLQTSAGSAATPTPTED